MAEGETNAVARAVVDHIPKLPSFNTARLWNNANQGIVQESILRNHPLFNKTAGS